MKKRLVITLLVISMFVVMLAACGNKATDVEKEEKKDGETVSEEVEKETEAEAEVEKEDDKGEPSEEVETVKIGLMIALTGSGVQAGEEAQTLAKIFTDIINNEHEGVSLPFADSAGLPNLGGAKIEFVVGDLSTPDVALAEAERLITEEKVVGIAGAFSSATTKTAMVAAEKHGVPLLSEGTSITLPEANYKFYGRSLPGDDTFVRDSFDYLDYISENQEPIKTIALVSEDSEFGINIANMEREFAKEYGYEVVEDIAYSQQSTNVTSEVMRLKEANPDAILMSSYAADSLLFMQTYKELNYFPKLLFGQRGGFVASDFALNLGNDADYVMSGSRWNADMQNEAAQTIAELFKEETGLTLLGDSLANVWNGVIMACIVNQAGSTDGEDMRQAMTDGLDLDPSLDPFALEGYKYEANGPNVYGKSIICQYKDGVLNTIFPEDSASMDVLYPAKNWSDR